jgi:hypothetical protein
MPRKWVEILKTGTFQDSAGNPHTFTGPDLDAIAAAYDPARHEAPVTIGHPKDNAPAYGWVKALKRVGETLVAEFKDLVPEFVAMVNQGLFKKRSVSLFPDRSLRHVGFLGAAPPAVKGLADCAFADPDSVTLETDVEAAFSEEPPAAAAEVTHRDFSDYRIPVVGRVLTSLREWMIEKFGVEDADKIVSNYDLDELKQWIPESPAPSAAPVSSMAAPAVAEIPADAALTAQNRKLQADLDKERTDRRRAEAASFCDGLAREARLLPAQRAVVLDLMEVLHGAGEFEFSEGGKASSGEKFKAFLQALPRQVEFVELARRGEGGADLTDPKAIAAAAIEFQDSEAKAGRTISVTAAVGHVTKGK